MRYSIGLSYQPCTLMIPVRSLKPCVLRIKVSDISMQNTYLTNRFKVMAGASDDVLYVQMPLAPKNALVEIYDEAVGDVPMQQETSFDVSYTTSKMKKIGLVTHASLIKATDFKLMEFVNLAQRFCYNAGVLPGDKDYVSAKRSFTIQYSNIIKDDDGSESLTPARVDKYSGIIEVSKKKFVGKTVPERMCIVLHEYAHLNMNEDEYNELEADLNGLTVYLGLGYPRFEALENYVDVFYNCTTDENMNRYKHIENFINNFDQFFNGKNI